MKKYFRNNPFQLDLFKKGVKLGFAQLKRLRSGMKFYAAMTHQLVTYRFSRNDQFFFESQGHVFSASDFQAASLELLV